MAIAGYTDDEILAVLEYLVSSKGDVYEDAGRMYRSLTRTTQMLANILADEFGAPLDVECYDMFDEMWCEIKYARFSVKVSYDLYLLPKDVQYEVLVSEDVSEEAVQAVELAFERVLASEEWKTIENFGFAVKEEDRLAEVVLEGLKEALTEWDLNINVWSVGYAVYYDRMKFVVDAILEVGDEYVSVSVKGKLAYRVVPGSVEVVEG